MLDLHPWNYCIQVADERQQNVPTAPSLPRSRGGTVVEVDAILNLVAIIGDLWRYHGDLQMDWSHFPGDAPKRANP